MNNKQELSLQELQKVNGGQRIYTANGYSWRDKKGHWHYTVTKGNGAAAIGTIVNGWAGAAAGGWL